MNSFLLLHALRDHLAAPLNTLPLLTRGRERASEALTRPAKAYISSLPPRNAKKEFDAPFILIQPTGGHEDAEGCSHETVALRLAVWNEDPEGAENDLHNLIALVRRAILPARGRALAGRYILTPNSKGALAPWTRPDEQNRPFVEAYISTNWKFKGYE